MLTRLHGRKGHLELVNAANQITEEPFTHGRVPIEEPLYCAAPCAERPRPELFFHKVLEPYVHDMEPRLGVVREVVFAEVVKRRRGEGAPGCRIPPGVDPSVVGRSD